MRAIGALKARVYVSSDDARSRLVDTFAYQPLVGTATERLELVVE